MKSNIHPKVSIIVPCRNEEKHIEECIESILKQEYPKEKIEVLVIDGMSKDGTRKIITEYVKIYSFIKMIDNPKLNTSAALNIGIMNSGGQIILIMGAHSIYKKNYVLKSVTSQIEYEADNVGGVIITQPKIENVKSWAISLALSQQFGVGNSAFRMGAKRAIWVDTVFGGCYRKEIFDKVGLFNEKLKRNQDLEFNLRLKRAGGRILLVPDLISYYHTPSNFWDLFKRYFQNGFWVMFGNKFAKIPFSFRHIVPFFFVSSLVLFLTLSLVNQYFFLLFLFILISYSITNFGFSLFLSAKNNLKYLLPLLITFAILHFSYGLGSWWGAMKILFDSISHWRNSCQNSP